MGAVRERGISGGVVGGGLLVLLGLLAVLAPFFAGIALAIVLGAVLVFGALVHVAAAFSAGSLLGIVWQLLLGVVYGTVGVLVLVNPLLGLTTLTLLVIAFFAVEGVVQLGWAVVGGKGSRLWLGLSGAISLLLAAVLWVGFPVTALLAVGVLFGVDLLVTGGALILHHRTGAERPSGEAAAEPTG
jgi:uncharacterized membrane protein HdeD (DUF308 family)